MGKIGPKFSHLLTVRAEGADPPSPSPLMVSLTVKRPFFDDFLYQIYKKKTDRGWVPLMIQVNLNKWGG